MYENGRTVLPAFNNLGGTAASIDFSGDRRGCCMSGKWLFLRSDLVGVFCNEARVSERDLAGELREEIHQARARVYQVGEATPLQSMVVDGIPNPVWVKREDLGPIKAYKWRGAYNAMACLSPEQLAGGVVVASAGNHAQGIALAARRLSATARIFMPKPTPLVKRRAVIEHGGDHVSIELVGDSFAEAQEAALQYAEESGATFIPPYDSLKVMAGQGNLADEIFTSGEGPFDRVYVAIGGGGMASAVATLLKGSWPDVRVIGVEGVDQASMSAAFAANGPTPLDYVDVFCDGTAVAKVGELTYEICRSQLDGIITVTNQEVSAAIKAHWDGLRVIPEPSGAMSLAAYQKDFRAGKVKEGEKVLTILCGANMDFAKLTDISRLAGINPRADRSWQFAIPEENGSLVKLLTDLPDGICSMVARCWIHRPRFSLSTFPRKKKRALRNGWVGGRLRRSMSPGAQNQTTASFPLLPRCINPHCLWRWNFRSGREPCWDL